jgi:hypothetical protein
LEVVLSVAIGPSLRLETATGFSEYASTSTRAPIGLQKVAVFAGTSVKAVCVSTDMSTATIVLNALINIIAGPCIVRKLETTLTFTRKGASRVNTLVFTSSITASTFINISARVSTAIERESTSTRASERAIGIGTDLITVVTACQTLVNIGAR